MWADMGVGYEIIYYVIVLIVLVNLLIAMMSSTYQVCKPTSRSRSAKRRAGGAGANP